MFLKSNIKKIGLFAVLVTLLSIGAVTYANHSWGNYHWARTGNPFTVKLGDSVSTAWDSYLGIASNDWSQSLVLDTSVVSGSTNPRLCRGTSGKVEVCNSKYGYNGWLGIASIWISGNHITKGTVKLNDSYFNYSTYNKPGWKSLVMCQEIGHTLGLDHQDENFNNEPIIPHTCMDYFVPGDNEIVGPNQHDYDQLEAIYGGHFDSITTLTQNVSKKPNRNDVNIEEWLNSRSDDLKKKLSVLEHDLGNGDKVVDFIIWVQE